MILTAAAIVAAGSGVLLVVGGLIVGYQIGRQDERRIQREAERYD